LLVPHDYFSSRRISGPNRREFLDLLPCDLKATCCR
jgi:hypothetical protein